MDPQQFFSQDEASLNGPCRRIPLKAHQYQNCPYNCIGLIRANWKGNQVIATGFLISSCLVLTSAHSFYLLDKSSIVEIKPISFSISDNGSNQDVIKFQGDYYINPKYVEIINRIKTLTEKKLSIKKSNLSQSQKNDQLQLIKQECYVLKQESQIHDYALLKIQKMIDRQHYFNLQIATNSKHIVTVSGYSKTEGQASIYYHSNQLITSPLGGLYDIDTKSGQSGSPVFLDNDKTEVVGIHKGYEIKKNLNICTLVTQEMITKIVKWSKLFALEKVFCKIPQKLEEKLFQNGQNKYSSNIKQSQIKGSKKVKSQKEEKQKQREIFQIKSEFQNLKKQNLKAVAEKQQAIKILNEFKIISQYQKSKLQEEISKLKKQMQKKNSKPVKQFKPIKESITQSTYITIAQELQKYSAAQRKQIVELQIINTSSEYFRQMQKRVNEGQICEELEVIQLKSRVK